MKPILIEDPDLLNRYTNCTVIVVSLPNKTPSACRTFFKRNALWYKTNGIDNSMNLSEQSCRLPRGEGFVYLLVDIDTVTPAVALRSLLGGKTLQDDVGFLYKFDSSDNRIVLSDSKEFQCTRLTLDDFLVQSVTYHIVEELTND